MLLTVGDIWVIRTATWTYVGLVTHSTAHYVQLAPGSWKIPNLNDEPTWLETGKFAQGDEAFPIPGPTRIPTLWVGPSDMPCEKFIAEMPFWKRTHPPVEAAHQD